MTEQDVLKHLTRVVNRKAERLMSGVVSDIKAKIDSLPSPARESITRQAREQAYEEAEEALAIEIISELVK